MKLLVIFEIFLLSLFTVSEARKLKILMNMPFIAYSHAKFQGHLADILVSEGHYVVSRGVEFTIRLATRALARG